MNCKVFLNCVLLIAVSCRAGEPMESCTTAVMSDQSRIDKLGKPYSSAILLVDTDNGTNKIWCNASLNLSRNGSTINATLVTAKHCVNPFNMDGMDLEITGTNGIIPAKIKSDFIENIKRFSAVADQKTEAIFYGNKSRNVEMYIPSRSPKPSSYPDYIDEQGNSLEDKYASYKDFDAQIAFEQSEYGKPLCELAFKTDKFPNKACFTADDLIAFEVELYDIDSKYVSQLENAIDQNETGYSDVDNFVKTIVERSSVEFELLQAETYVELKRCKAIPDHEICKEASASGLLDLRKNESFYKGNQYITYSAIAADIASTASASYEFESAHSNLFKKYFDISEIVIKHLSEKVTAGESLSLFTNIEDRASDDQLVHKAAFIRLQQINGGAILQRAYGVVASLDPNYIRLGKGDSGSMLMYDGVPIAVLSTFDGEPISSGRASALPKRGAEIAVIPADEQPVSSVDPNAEVPVVVAKNMPQAAPNPVVADNSSVDESVTQSPAATDPASSSNSETVSSVGVNDASAVVIVDDVQPQNCY